MKKSMSLKEYENKIGHSIEEMTYEEMLYFCETHQNDGIDENLSYIAAYWLGKLYEDNLITIEEYNRGLSVLRNSIIESKRFNCILVETESPDQKDYFHFYVSY